MVGHEAIPDGPEERHDGLALDAADPLPDITDLPIMQYDVALLDGQLVGELGDRLGLLLATSLCRSTLWLLPLPASLPPSLPANLLTSCELASRLRRD